MANADFTTEELNNEIWELIENHPNYAVSNLGRVMRATDGATVRAGFILKTTIRSRGFDYVSIYKHGCWYIHELVIKAFLDEPTDNSTEIRHKDGDRRNNRASNLEWCFQVQDIGVFTKDEIKTEIWNVVTSNENYAISNLGRVKRIAGGAGSQSEHHLRMYPSNGGHLRVMLYYGERKKTINHLVHQLVARSFIGEPPEGRKNVNHIDCNPRNNRASNLEWVSHRENSQHMVKMGNSSKGEKHHGTNLKDADIPVIWYMLQKGQTLKHIAICFNASPSIIGNIKRGITWTHIKIEGRNIPNICPTCGHAVG